MRLEFSVIQMFDGIFHVLVANELHNARAVLVDVGKAHVARLSHVILEVLPAARCGQARYYATVVGAARRRTITTAATVRAAATRTLLKLDAQLMAVVVVAIAAVDRVLGIAGIVELDERERRPFPVLQVDVLDFAVFVEDVLDVFGSNVVGQITFKKNFFKKN